METAIALVQRIMGGKGYTVESLHVDDSGLVAILVDKTGKRWDLRLAQPAPAAPAEIPLQIAEPRPEEPAIPSVPAPTVMAKKSGFSAKPMFDLIKTKGAKLSNEARGILAELERMELQIGDDQLVLSAARKAEHGDIGALRELRDKRRPPAAHATAPPH